MGDDRFARDPAVARVTELLFIGRGSPLAQDLSLNPHQRRDDMLSDNAAIATVAVKNLETAKRFYEGTLGLPRVMENDEVLAFKTGGSTLFVYRSQYAGSTKA